MNLPTTAKDTTSRISRAAEVAAVATHLAKLDRHLAELGKPAEAAVARRLAERLRAAVGARRRRSAA